MIREWLDEYHPKNNAGAEQALREILQEIALAGLQRSGFFEKAAFYGGTALRIFHRLDRFSEDLDFSLLEKNVSFSLEPYLHGMQQEFQAHGIKVTIAEKSKTKETNVDSAFLKADTEWKELILRDILPQEKVGLSPQVKIKLEVDKSPPPGFTTEEKLLLRPFSFYVKCYRLPDLFAGKMHALLFRSWKNRVKGRDWYDLEWYVKQNVPLHLEHLKLRAIDSGNWHQADMTEKQLMKLLNDKIDTVSVSNMIADIIKFIPDSSMLKIWSAGYFHDLAGKIKFLPS